MNQPEKQTNPQPIQLTDVNPQRLHLQQQQDRQLEFRQTIADLNQMILAGMPAHQAG